MRASPSEAQEAGARVPRRGVQRLHAAADAGRTGAERAGRARLLRRTQTEAGLPRPRPPALSLLLEPIPQGTPHGHQSAPAPGHSVSTFMMMPMLRPSPVKNPILSSHNSNFHFQLKPLNGRICFYIDVVLPRDKRRCHESNVTWIRSG